MKRLWKWIKSWFKKDKPDPQPEPDNPAELPQNPQTGENLPNSISEMWTFKRKDYDKSYRIAFPSHFARKMGIDERSHCTVNGMTAKFRGYDDDHGAKRPKYTLPQSTPLTAPLTCILYRKAFGEAVGWFKCDGFYGKDYLPDMQGEAVVVDPDEPTPQPESSGNVPDINGRPFPPDWSTNSDRNWQAGRAEVGEYHGRVVCKDYHDAANFRYSLRPHFEHDLDVLCLSPVAGKPHSGCVSINAGRDGIVTWSVNP